jgi:hypothetical protein
MPMKAILTLALAVLSAAGAHAQTRPLVISCEDPVFAEDTTHDRVVAAFGKENVRLVSEPGPEGSPPNVKSVIYPNDPKRRLEISWNNGKARAEPFAFLFEQKSQWVAPLGVRIGTSLAELEKLNGEPFTLSGFGGMLDGMAGWTGALNKLPGGCFLGGNLSPTAKLPKRVMDKISGDDDFPSTHPAMRQAKPTLHQVQVVYTRDPFKRQ